MPIESEIGTVNGITTDTLWAQALVTPSVCGVVEVEDSSGGALKVGVEVLTTLTHADSGISGLKDLGVLANIPKGNNIRTILLMVSVGHTIYIVLRGEGSVYLKRGDKLARLIDKVGSISGEVKKGDTLILGTKHFVSSFTDQQLHSAFSPIGAKALAEKLTLMLHETNKEGGVALIFEVKKLDDVVESLPPIKLPLRKNVLTWLRALPRRTLILGAVTACIALFFAISVVLGVIRQQGFRKNGEIVNVLSEARRDLEEGNALLELNPLKGRERLESAYNLLLPLSLSLSPKSEQGKVVADLFAQVSEALSLSKNSVSQEPQLFYDVGLLKSGSAINSIGLYEARVSLLDSTTSTAYGLDIISKNGQIIAGGSQYSGASLVTIHGGMIYVLTGDGIHQVDSSSKKTTPLVIKKSEEWKKISSLIAYGGNLYLLDTGASRIWKYVATDKGFSQISEYLNPDTFVDLAKGTSISIDGSVWVGTQEGKILRFIQGRQETFVPRGVEPAFEKLVAVFASDDAKNLYVLDSTNKRVVVLDKDGMYIGQYIWQSDISPTQLVVSEAQRKIFLLAAGKLYSLDLK